MNVPMKRSVISALPRRSHAVFELICATVTLEFPCVMLNVESMPPMRQKGFSSDQDCFVT